MDTEQRMRTALKEGAEGLRLAAPGPAAARERARQHARRRQAGMGGLTALAVVLAGVTGWQLLPEQQVELERGQVADGGGANLLADLEWRAAEGVVGGDRTVLHVDGDVYYALSTAPGSRSEDHPDGAVPQALYRSADGLSWEMAELGEKPWIADLGARNGLLYAISTAPTTSGLGSGRVGISEDGGQSWTEIDLPSGARPPEATVPVLGPVVTASIAVGEAGLLAQTTTRYSLDADEVFSAQERTEHSWVRYAPEGLVLMDGAACEVRDELAMDHAVADDPVPPADVPMSEPCVDAPDQSVRTVPWSEIGLDSEHELRADELFRSIDGETWEPITAPAFAGQRVEQFTAGPDGFYASVYNPWSDHLRMQLLHSADGTAWQEIPVPGWVTSLGFVGERIVGLVEGEAGTVAISSSNGGATWTQTHLGELVPHPGSAEQPGVVARSTGPLGAAVVMVSWERDKPTLHLLTSSDGVHWSTVPVADITGDEPGAVSWVAVGEDSIALAASWAGEGKIRDTRMFVGTPVRR